MWLFVFAIAGIVVWLAVDALKHRVRALETRADLLESATQAIASLQRRVEALEAAGATTGAVPPTVSAPIPAFAPTPSPVRTGSDTWLAPGPPPPVPTPPVPEAAAPAVTLPTATPTLTPTRRIEREPAAATAPPASDEAWEVVVGTSWLNKIGVFVFVLGLALLVGYSFTRIGPVGRVTLAYAISTAMLGVGVWLEAQREFKTYAHGLLAGGWAAVYFTTYAARAVPAAQLTDSDVTAAFALAAVATAMIAHSLKYRSETLTAMAYLIGFATLALTPLSQFSFFASIPLALSLVVVANRFGWDRISLFGLVATYALFTLREALFPGAWLDPQSASRYIALGAYWLIFEVADITRLRRDVPDRTAMPLVAVNAAAFGGATLLQAPDDASILTAVIGSMAVGYLASAAARWTLIPSAKPTEPDGQTTPLTSSHVALFLSSALFAWLLQRRFAGTRETIALLLETEVLLATALAMRDRWIRWASAGVMMATIAATAWVVLAAAGDTRAWPWTMWASTPAVALVAVALIGNREWLGAKRLGLLPVEDAYSWLAFAAVGSILVRECDLAWLGLAGLVFAYVLLEPGMRGRLEYFQQAAIAALVSSAVLLWFFGGVAGSTPPEALVWRVMPLAMLLAYGFAARILWNGRTASPSTATATIAMLMSGAGSLLLTVFEWRVVPATWTPAVWAATGAALVGAGYFVRRPEQRWIGYAKAGVSAGAVSMRLWQTAPDSLMAIAPAVCVTAALYGLSGGTRHLSRSAAGREEDALGVSVSSALATWLVVLIEWRLASADALAVVWGVTAIVLLAVGYARRGAEDLRWQASVLLALSVLREAGLLLDPEPLSPVWPWVEVVLVYALALGTGRLSQSGDTAASADERLPVALFVAGAVLLTLVIRDQVTPAWLVPAWGIQGMALLFSGFFRRERALRLSGLGLLFLCLARLGYDIGRLDALGRIISFVVLGLVLLAVSWTYTRYREQMKKWL